MPFGIEHIIQFQQLTVQLFLINVHHDENFEDVPESHQDSINQFKGLDEKDAVFVDNMRFFTNLTVYLLFILLQIFFAMKQLNFFQLSA